MYPRVIRMLLLCRVHPAYCDCLSFLSPTGAVNPVTGRRNALLGARTCALSAAWLYVREDNRRLQGMNRRRKGRQMVLPHGGLSVEALQDRWSPFHHHLLTSLFLHYPYHRDTWRGIAISAASARQRATKVTTAPAAFRRSFPHLWLCLSQPLTFHKAVSFPTLSARVRAAGVIKKRRLSGRWNSLKLLPAVEYANEKAHWRDEVHPRSATLSC